MHEMLLSDRAFVACTENANFITDTRITELHHAYADLDAIGKGKRGEIIALHLYQETDHRTALDIVRTAFDQRLINCGAESAAIDHVVDMPIDIVVHPTRRDLANMPIVTTPACLCSYQFPIISL
jgi:hypothetical protein